MADAEVQSYNYNHSRAGAAIAASTTHSCEPLSLAPFLLSPAGETLLVAKRECPRHSWRSFLSVRLGIQTTRHTFSSHPYYSTHVASLQDSTGNFGHSHTFSVSWIVGGAALNGARRSFHGFILVRLQIVTDMLFLDYIPWFLCVFSSPCIFFPFLCSSFRWLCFLLFPFILFSFSLFLDAYSGDQDPWSCLETGEHRGRCSVDDVNFSVIERSKNCLTPIWISFQTLYLLSVTNSQQRAPGVGVLSLGHRSTTVRAREHGVTSMWRHEPVHQE